jgi:NAD(P)-dependent dehydrogenase (short-subunit alcohol dehydrogenase family)
MAPIEADLHGRVFVVTGASAGIGKEVARGLARLGAHVVLACRNADKGRAVQRDIGASAPGSSLELAVVDLERQSSVRHFAADVLERHAAVHGLVNNAGVWLEARRETVDGIEATWATNVLGAFQLTQLLLPRLVESAPARIVNVASLLAGGLDLEDVQFRTRGYSGVSAYSQSKQANRLFTWALARRLDGSGVTANAVHPGGVNTELFRKAGGWKGAAASVWSRFQGKTPAEGADSVLWLAASAEAAGLHDALVVDRRTRTCEFRGPDEEPLWRLCDSMRV